MQKTYMIVTNDELEQVVDMGLTSTQVADFFGMNRAYIYDCVCKGKWSHLRKYKPVVEEVFLSGYKANYKKRPTTEYVRKFYEFLESEKMEFVYEFPSNAKAHSAKKTIRDVMKRKNITGIWLEVRKNYLIAERE